MARALVWDLGGRDLHSVPFSATDSWCDLGKLLSRPVPPFPICLKKKKGQDDGAALPLKGVVRISALVSLTFSESRAPKCPKSLLKMGPWGAFENFSPVK